ncbi:hypothetical protein BXT86_01010 [candidate division WOR-3 bacterium 4484_100]|uniref:GGDEF domain-containing protein n=1 Tax=candidate division WOR-3 bacterium 4484_100 TaxID=1936077 RepID=A0A1V4QGK0_UNCW3|nr:MAG: hypothetical protein BXT86_01010 [candidate division WOR-3 bacterium 4484_100]
MKEIYFDELTGVYNRRFLRRWIDDEIKRANRFATNFALILLDLDNFRDINNNFGHLEGDRVLVEFANFLQNQIREVDNLIRYGGDEFIILMPNTNIEGTVELAQRILENLRKTAIAGHKVYCSIGYAVFPNDGTAAEVLINKADNLMYQAKKQGKNRIGVKQEVIRRLQIPAPITVGRDQEVRWALGQISQFNVVFIAGTAGIGKTRLVIEIKERLNAERLLRGNAYEALALVPYHPFKNLFNELINRNFALTQQSFKQLPEIYQRELAKLLPAEGFLRTARGEELDKYRLYNAVSEFINILARMSSGMTILFMDDLHWADQSSCELLDFLIRSVKENIKIFGTYRVEEIKNTPIAKFWGIWAREKLYTQITLRPLNQMQTHQLLEEIMGPVPENLDKFIYLQSGGNPFYIEELLRELERQKKFYYNGRVWVLSKDLDLAIPSSITETVKRKLKFLEDEIKGYLEIAAVFGQEFNADIIATATRRNVGQIIDAFDALRELGLIKERGPDTYFFTEDIVRHIVYKQIPRGNLMKLHRLVGEAIEIFYQNTLPNYYEQLAHHFTTANDVHKALYYSKKAAEKAKNNYAHSLAIKFYENALRFEDNIDEIFKIKFALADIYYLIGEYKKALEQLNDCLKIDPNAYRVYEKIGNVYEAMGEYKNSLKHYKKGLQITQGTEMIYVFRNAIAWLYTRMGRYKEAEKEVEDIVKSGKHLSKQVIGDTYVIMGIVYLRLGKFEKAEKCIKKSLSIRESIGDKKRIAACYLDLALNYYGQFNLKMSEKFNNKALEIYRSIGYQGGILITLNNLAVFYTGKDLNKAEEYCLRALTQAKLIGAKRTMVYLYNNLGSINYNRLMDEQAIKNYRQALKIAQEINFPEAFIFSNVSLSEYYREHGKIKKGRSYLTQAQKKARELNIKYLNFDCLMEEVEYHILGRQYKKADQLTRKLVADLKKESNIQYKIYGLISRAKVLVAMKKYTQAQNYYRRAERFMKPVASDRILGEIYYLCGIAYRKAGKPEQAMKAFVEANKRFARIGNLRFLDRIEQEITKL